MLRPAAAGVISLAAAAGLAAGWATVTAPLAVSLPRDHGAHPEFRSEWWYATGTLADEGGRRFGFQLTFFREGLDPSPPVPGASTLRAREALAAHLAVADIRSGHVLFAQRVRRLTSALAWAATDDLGAGLENWTMRRLATGAIALSAEDRDAGIDLALSLAPEKPLVLHGESGLCAKGPGRGNASAYVSFTRLAAGGTLSLGGRQHRVHGDAWFDHEWGTSQLGPGVVGWDWMGLRLGDGRELMLYRLRRADGGSAPESGGTLVERDGLTRRLGPADFTLEPEGSWSSPRTGVRYPARVRVLLPSAALDLQVRPIVADAELDARVSTGTIYWEGPVTVSGTVPGEGYLELTGYAGSIAGLF